MYRLRRLLETEAARKAVKPATDMLVGLLEQAERDVESAGSAGDVLALATANRRFHFTLFEAAGMPRLVQLLGLLWDSTAAYRSVYYDDPEQRSRFEAEHRAIIEAVRVRDVRGLVRLLNVHRDASIDSLRQAISDLKQGGG